jgi:hypothetical protein
MEHADLIISSVKIPHNVSSATDFCMYFATKNKEYLDNAYIS